MVAMGLHFIAMPIVQAPWYYEADLARVAAFADNVIRPIYGSLVMTILRFLWAGYSPAARNYEVISPNWTYRDVDGQVKKVWDNGNIGALVYKNVIPLKPETARPKYTSGNFDGIEYDERFGAGSFIINGLEQKTIDRSHAVWAVHDSESEDGSPYGFPRIAHCAPIFHMYRWLWTLLGRAFENSADPGPVVRFPTNELPTQDSVGNKTSNTKKALRIGTRRRSGSTIALPSDVYKDFQDRPTGTPLWAIEYPKGDTNFEALLNFIGYLEASKLRALWLQEQGLIGDTSVSGSTSNRNVMESAGDQRDASQTVLVRQIDRLIDDVFVVPAVQMAFPEYTGTVRKRTIGMGTGETDLIRQFFQLIGQDNWRNFGVDARRLAESTGFPMLDPAEQQRQLEDAANQASSAPTPAVEPTNGRRALVTQTGFGQTEYVQLGGSIELSDDGDFVSDLPSTDVYSEKGNVAVARELRNASVKFLSWAYRDFALYISKQEIPEFGTVVSDDLADEEFLRGDRIKQFVDRMLRGWRPRQETVDGFSKSLRSSMEKVFSRTSSAQLKRMRSNARVSIDRDAAKWLDERGAESVRSIMSTTREQLASALADGVREGKTAKQIASDIRSNFQDIPAGRAKIITLTEVPRAYNFATVHAGLAAGVRQAQLIDGEDHDERCRVRNGRIVPLEDALDEDLHHPCCQFQVRLLSRSKNLSIRREQLEGERLALYDDESETILLSPELDYESEVSYLLAIGKALE